MTVAMTKPTFREEWSAMTLYERFEQSVIVVLTGIIMVIVLAALWQLMREVGMRIVADAFDPLDYATFQAVFGMIFTVVIALEFKRSLLVAMERRFGIVQVRSIILIALLAIVRKFIILDLAETDPAKIAALAGATLALGAVYWLVRDQDMRERAEAGAA
ncbi:MAG: phosphate-starvation-inducible PsiE family protein [Tabrizicola sp.]